MSDQVDVSDETDTNVESENERKGSEDHLNLKHHTEEDPENLAKDVTGDS